MFGFVSLTDPNSSEWWCQTTSSPKQTPEVFWNLSDVKVSSTDPATLAGVTLDCKHWNLRLWLLYFSGYTYFFCAKWPIIMPTRNMILTSPCCPSRQMVPSMFIFVYVKPCHGRVSSQLATFVGGTASSFTATSSPWRLAHPQLPWWESLPNQLISIQLGWQYEVLWICVFQCWFFNAIALLPSTSSTGPQPPSPRSHLRLAPWGSGSKVFQHRLWLRDAQRWMVGRFFPPTQPGDGW